MNKRFCKLGKYAAKAFFLFAVCGSTYSCKDDYMWDDGNPSWLGSSIYEYLESEGNYTNFVKLINDLGYKEVLARTGSKTLFVADDDAFKAFYKDNPWGVGSYSELTLSQKKLLLNNAMINNAYLLEMMSSMQAGNGTNDTPVKGQCLRRNTAGTVLDSVPHLFPTEMPTNYNPTDKDYWAQFRNNDKDIYIALDNTAAMMTHFLPAQMALKSITDDDFRIITGKTREKNDAFIYDCKVIKQDITCQNGYVNLLDKVLITPPNIAELLRTNGKTNIFSHMMDRFSAPFYNADLTYSYRLNYGNDVEKVYEKRYFSERSKNGDPLKAYIDPDNPNQTEDVTYSLKFDPGWNSYNVDLFSKEQDMAAFFCPTDEKLIPYFFSPNGGGYFLMQAYAADMLSELGEAPTDMELINKALDMIPRNVIQELINNLMMESFVASVPSKFESIKNKAQDAMFNADDDYHRGKINDVLLANNGVIYLMDEVITTPTYAAVLAPALTETDKRIFRYAIESMSLDSRSESDANALKSYYDSYLLSMSSRFSFFVPSDDDFWYIDPISFRGSSAVKNGTTQLVGRAYKYMWDETKDKVRPTVETYEYIYDVVTKSGSIGSKLSANQSIGREFFSNRLKDLLETHTIVHENNKATGIDETETGVECGRHYFYSKNNSVVYVENANERANGMKVKGGWQLDHNENCTVTRFADKSAQTNGYGNGFAYTISNPMVPTIESVYSIMHDNKVFSKFFALCQTPEDVLDALDVNIEVDPEDGTEINNPSARNKYYIFDPNSSGLPCYAVNEEGKLAKVADDTNIRFFSNYRYTIYIPTNDAMDEAFAKGLPTWDDIKHLLQLDLDEDERESLDEEEEHARKIKGKAMAATIINFVKYHFQDNSVYSEPLAMNPTAYETGTMDSKTGIYFKVTTSRESDGTIKVTDRTGNSCTTNPSLTNFIARDYITNDPSGSKAVVETKILSSSSAVIHGLNGVLNYKELTGGRYDSDWKTLAKARAYLKKYQLAK